MEHIIDKLEKSQVGNLLLDFFISWKGIIFVIVVIVLTILNKKENNFISLKDIEGFIKKSKKE